MIVEIGGRFTYDSRSFIKKTNKYTFYEGYDNVENSKVIIKRFSVRQQRYMEWFVKEKCNFEAISSLYVVKCYYSEILAGQQEAVMVMEYMEGGSLKSLLERLPEDRTLAQSNPQFIDEKVATAWMVQALMGLKCAWDHRLVHADVSPSGLLLSGTGYTASVKIYNLNTKSDIEDSVSWDAIQANMRQLGITYCKMLLGTLMEYDSTELIARVMSADVSEFAKKAAADLLFAKPGSHEDFVRQFRFTLLAEGRKTNVYFSSIFYDMKFAANTKEKEYNPRFFEFCKAELDVLMSLSDENCVAYLDSYQNSTSRFVLEEYCVGGDLHTFIAEKGPLNYFLAKDWMRSLLKTVKRLHQGGIIHTNISPRTVLLDAANFSAKLKISDFEFSCQVGSSRKIEPSSRDSLAYLAPELLSPRVSTETVDEAADVWSLGGVFYYILQGEDPIPESDIKDQSQMPVLNFSSGLFESLIVSMLRFEKSERLNISECLEHPFFHEDIESSLHVPDSFSIIPSAHALLNKCIFFLAQHEARTSYLLCELIQKAAIKIRLYLIKSKRECEMQDEKFFESLSEFREMTERQLQAGHKVSEDPVEVVFEFVNALRKESEDRERYHPLLTEMNELKKCIIAVDRMRLELAKDSHFSS